LDRRLGLDDGRGAGVSPPSSTGRRPTLPEGGAFGFVVGKAPVGGCPKTPVMTAFPVARPLMAAEEARTLDGLWRVFCLSRKRFSDKLLQEFEGLEDPLEVVILLGVFLKDPQDVVG
jgi:hypothetical protein